MTNRIACLFLLIIAPLSPVRAQEAPGKSPSRPNLILVMVVDQLRADTFTRFASRLMPAKQGGKLGGFNYLLSGAYYPLGEYDTFQCMTGPGHATILSGSHPYTNGIAQNLWFDQKSQKPMYCVQDDSTPIVGTEKPKKRTGSTPQTLLSTTLGDEMKNSGFQSRIVSLALKDRAAILMGGHRANLAFWYDTNAMKWVSSRKYLPEGKLPTWIEKLNSDLARNEEKAEVWTAPTHQLVTSASKNEIDPKRIWGMSPSFPHQFKLNSQYSLRTPYGVKITRDAAIEALQTLKLGTGKSPDLLAVSFSTHDYGAHAWGPDSPEVEEITVAEDRAISDLLNEVNRTVPGGMSKVTLVLTADHGGPLVPENLTKVGVPAGRIDEAALGKKADERITAALGKAPQGESWVPFVADMAFYLNRPALEKKGSDAYVRAERIVKEALLEHPGTFMAVTHSDWIQRRPPPGELGRRFMLTYFPGRSGDVILLPKPYWISEDDSTGHMTPWAFDRYVPVIFHGPSFKPGRYGQPAKIVDIAPTLAFILGITPPSMSEGRVLHEALR